MSKLLLIAAREYLSYIRTVGFWVSLLLPPVIIGAAAIIPAEMERAAPPPVLAVVDLTGQGLEAAVDGALPRGRPIIRLVPPPPALGAAREPATAGREARRLIDAGVLDEAAVIHRGPDAVVIDFWSRNGGDEPTSRLLDAAVSQHLREARLAELGVPAAALHAAEALHPVIIDFAPHAAEGGQVSLRDRLPGLLGFGFAILLWSAITSGAGMLLNSVVEERANRILEVLASSADIIDILGGKILGAAGLTATVLGLWITVGLTLTRLTHPDMAADLFAVLIGQGLLAYFLAFFVAGYLMYAALFASVGAFCDTPREAQTLLGPMMLMLVVPLLCLNEAIKRPDSPMLHAIAWFPPFTPFLMPALAGSAPPLGEVVGAAAMLWAIAALALFGATKAFRAGIVATAKPNLLGWLRRR